MVEREKSLAELMEQLDQELMKEFENQKDKKKRVLEKDLLKKKIKTKKLKTRESTPLKGNLNKLMMDLASGTEFQRLIFKAIVGKVWRSTGEKQEKALEIILQFIRDTFGKLTREELEDPTKIQELIDKMKALSIPL